MTTTVLRNKKVLITVGPSREAIDPVRYISNHSSGKMGYAIADVLLQLGAKVIVVSGPVCLSLQHPNLRLIEVSSASEMYEACCRYFQEIDIAVFAAAVADYRPETVATHKIKKDESSFLIKMTNNVDIAFEFGKVKTSEQLSIGFALETNNELAHATAKLEKKNFDVVVLNSMKDANATFGYNTNRITIVDKNRQPKAFPLKSKTEVAADIVNEIIALVKRCEVIEASPILTI